MTRKIRITESADPAVVMDVVTRAATDIGFTLERHDATNATAHDNPHDARGSATATSARVGIQIHPGRIDLRSETTGAAYAGAAGVPFFTARINWRVSKLSRAVKRELQQAHLA